MARLKAEGLYYILHGAIIQSEPSTSVADFHPRGAGWYQLQWSHARQPKRPKMQSKSLRGHIGTGTIPYLSFNLKEAVYPLRWHPYMSTIGDTHWVFCCWVEGCPEGPLSPHATICTHVHHAHLYMKLSCSLCPITFFNTNALKWHGKWAHCSRVLDPT